MPPAIQWKIVATGPHACLVSSAVVPLPCVSEASAASNESNNVSYNSRLAVTFNSFNSTCTGDEAGDVGAKSMCHTSGICIPLTPQADQKVFVNGFAPIAIGDKYEMCYSNTEGVVVELPAVNGPNEPGNLADAEFDRQVARLIVAAIKTGKPLDTLSGLRKTELANNPVVVAAQHFCWAQTERIATRFLIDQWEGGKAWPYQGTINDVAWKSAQTLSATVQNGSNAGQSLNDVVEIWSTPQTDYDARVYKWSLYGHSLKGKRLIGWSPMKLVEEAADSGAEEKVRENERKAKLYEEAVSIVSPYIFHP